MIIEVFCISSNLFYFQPTQSVRLPQTIPNTYFDRDEQVNTNSGNQANLNTGTIPKIFGRGRGRFLQ